MPHPNAPIMVQLHKAQPDPAADPNLALFVAVRRATDALGYRNYAAFISTLFCPDDGTGDLGTRARQLADQQRAKYDQTDCVRFRGTNAYDQLVEATQLYIASQAALLDDCCQGETGRASEINFDALAVAKRNYALATDGTGLPDPNCYDVAEIERRFSPNTLTLDQFKALQDRMFDAPQDMERGPCCNDLPAPPPPAPTVEKTKGKAVPQVMTLAQPGSSGNGSQRNVMTFMQQLRDNMAGVPVRDLQLGSGNCYGILISKLRCPPMLELIWSYWMEQAMLVQGVNAMTLRFQNRMFPGSEGMRRFDISPLRPLNNLLWGYVQREPNRLTLARRAYEYDHHYGLRLRGSAVPDMAPADSRTQFIEAFHRLLQEAMKYFRLSMNTTTQADPFPAFDALRELHLVLAEGAHNQFGDLPTTARSEMLVQQWLLARPEVRDFLGGRPGVPFPEPWMPHMDTLRQVMGWNDASIRHYRDLASFGEQLLLSVRLVAWSNITNSFSAASWLTFWRPEIQAYVHAYRAVTGVDLAQVDTPITQGGGWIAQPSDLIGRRRSAHPLVAGR